MIQLTDIDIKILCFIREHDSASVTDMQSTLTDVDALHYRLEQLSTPEYRGVLGTSLPIPNTAYIEQDYESIKTDIGETEHRPLGIYHLTEFGYKSLQDYKYNQAAHKREIWLKNAWIPILVTLVTNLLIHGIKELWPLIQGWVSHTP